LAPKKERNSLIFSHLYKNPNLMFEIKKIKVLSDTITPFEELKAPKQIVEQNQIVKKEKNPLMSQSTLIIQKK
jgi:hypothetical protein